MDGRRNATVLYLRPDYCTVVVLLLVRPCQNHQTRVLEVGVVCWAARGTVVWPTIFHHHHYDRHPHHNHNNNHNNNNGNDNVDQVSLTSATQTSLASLGLPPSTCSTLATLGLPTHRPLERHKGPPLRIINEP